MDRSLAKRTLTQYECGFNSYKQFLLLAGFSWNDKYEMPPLSEDSLISMVDMALDVPLPLGLPL
jgi:hypothetical protein